MEAWAVPLLLVVGSLLAVQAAANVQLSKAMHSPLGASTLQLAVGSALLLIATITVGTTGAFGLLGEVAPWHLVGGLGSAVYITAGIVLFPRLGALVTVGLFITGQMLASLVLDTGGLLGVTAEPLRGASVIGVLAVLAGAALVVRAQRPATATGPTTAPQATTIPATTVPATAVPATAVPAAAVPTTTGSGSTDPASTGSASTVPAPGTKAASSAAGTPDSSPASAREPHRVLWLLFAVIGGAVLPVQGAINARLRADLDAPVTVAAFSFLVATAAMALVLLAVLRVTRAPGPQLKPLRAVPWWGWLGGLAGAGYVTSVFLLIPRIGAAPTIGLTIAGQQLASAAVDHYGLLRLPRRPVAGLRLAGVAVLLAGVALLQLT